MTVDITNPGASAQALQNALGVASAMLGNTTFYVATTGSDTTGNGTNVAPFASLQKALNYAATFNWGGYSCTISIANGTYTLGAAAEITIPKLLNCSSQTIVGNTITPGNVVLDVSNGSNQNGLNFAYAGFWNLAGVHIKCANSSAIIVFDATLTLNGNIEIELVSTGGGNFIDVVGVYSGILQNFGTITFMGTSSPNDYQGAFTVHGGLLQLVSVHGGAVNFANGLDFSADSWVTVQQGAVLDMSAGGVQNPLNAIGPQVLCRMGGYVWYVNPTLDANFGGTTPGVFDQTSGLGGGGINDDFVYGSAPSDVLQADTTYYVATTGSDTTGNGTSGSPWQTLQKAFNFVAEMNANGYNVTIQLADGTYVGGRITTPPLNLGALLVLGNAANQSAVIVQDTFAQASGCLQFDSGLYCVLQYLTFNVTVLYNLGITVEANHSNIAIRDCRFTRSVQAAACVGLWASFSEVVFGGTSVTVVGNWNNLIDFESEFCFVSFVSSLVLTTVTMSGFGAFYFNAPNCEVNSINGGTFSGSITGCAVYMNFRGTLVGPLPTGSTPNVLLGVGNTIYYVNTSGSDSANGLSPTFAWKTIAKVNATTFYPGDCILFQAGQTFGGAIVCPSTGTAASPITFGSYGNGKATISSTTSNGFTSTSQAGIIVRDLIFTGTAGSTGTNFGLSFIHTGTGHLSNIQIINCTISNYSLGGIYISPGTMANVGFNSGAGYDDVLIQGCDISAVCAGTTGGWGSAGIYMLGTSSVPSVPASFNNVIIRECNVHNITAHANDGNSTGSGIVFSEATNSYIVNCTASAISGSGQYAMWMWDCVNCGIIGCQANGTISTNNIDGGAFDLDKGCQNCMISDCLSYNNFGNGYLLSTGSGGQTFNNNSCINCVSHNDGSGAGSIEPNGINLWSNVSNNHTNTRVAGCTIYVSGSSSKGITIEGSFASTVTGLITNNTIVVSGTQTMVNTAVNPSGLVFNGNTYCGPIKVVWNNTTYASIAAWAAAFSQQEPSYLTTAIEVPVFTVSALPTGATGMVAYVSDGAASLAWGATVTGGSTVKYLAWHNGTNWTVAGK